MLNRVVSTPAKSVAESSARTSRHAIGTGLVEVERVSIVFGKGKNAIKAVEETSIRIEPGEFVCILGPSGCGKSPC